MISTTSTCFVRLFRTQTCGHRAFLGNISQAFTSVLLVTTPASCCSRMHTNRKVFCGDRPKTSPQLFPSFCFGNTQYESTPALKYQTVGKGVPVAKFDVPTTSSCSCTRFSLSHGSAARKRIIRFKEEGRACLFGKGSMVDTTVPTPNTTRHGGSTIMCKAGRQEGVS